ncbi:MAG: S49 family peptidase, partial [Gammaproteobacteria bacterium]|nr:S49 family peptidase [Gammaproteobacteria bacterium]MCB1871349.1 S49 family peptidase [Gammaproteobacteria bacterium]MCB1904756.1 S49 family peptidase [Gammaproteobacteria bacterium]
EQRKARRWSIFFKLFAFAYLTVLLMLWLPEKLPDASLKPSGKHTAVIEVKGVIASDTEASADKIIGSLRKAFEDEKTKGVILRINSPGGSPVQSGYINDEINRLKKQYPDTPVYAVVTDLCASGGYYIAVAADKIYVDKASIVGSIGVLMNGFGFVGSMEKLGVERRLLTAGENKAIFDPFSPLKPNDMIHMRKMLDRVHRQFIDTVKAGRGERLQESEEIFSGLFWTGEESIKLGLADELGSSSYVAREVIGAENLVDFTDKEDLLERFAKRLGAGTVASLSRLMDTMSAPMLR